MNTNYDSNDEDDKLVREFTAFMDAVTGSARADYRRRQKHWNREIPYDDVLTVKQPDYDETQPSAPAGNFEFEERRMAEVFSKLTSVWRQILTLSFVYRFQAQEIADMLGRSVEYVYMNKHRAIKKMRDYILNGGGSDKQ